jgi:hypothetical protein
MPALSSVRSHAVRIWPHAAPVRRWNNRPCRRCASGSSAISGSYTARFIGRPPRLAAPGLVEGDPGTRQIDVLPGQPEDLPSPYADVSSSTTMVLGTGPATWHRRRGVSGSLALRGSAGALGLLRQIELGATSTYPHRRAMRSRCRSTLSSFATVRPKPGRASTCRTGDRRRAEVADW